MWLGRASCIVIVVGSFCYFRPHAAPTIIIRGAPQHLMLPGPFSLVQALGFCRRPTALHHHAVSATVITPCDHAPAGRARCLSALHRSVPRPWPLSSCNPPRAWACLLSTAFPHSRLKASAHRTSDFSPSKFFSDSVEVFLRQCRTFPPPRDWQRFFVGHHPVLILLLSLRRSCQQH